MINTKFVFLLAFLATVLVMNTECSKAQKGCKTWKFVFSLDGPPANFLNDKGKLVGQSVSMVKEICKRACKKCKLTYTEDRSLCWNSVTNRSIILDEGRAQICANLVESPPRNQHYTFPEQSIYRLPKSVLIRKPGNTDVTFDKLKECNSFTMGHPSNTALTRDCLVSGGLYVEEANAIAVSTTGSIVAGQSLIADKVLSGELDFGLVIPRLLFRNDVEIFGEISCSDILIGLNMMVRQPTSPDDEAQEFLDWWDPTLKDFICGNGSFCTKKCNDDDDDLYEEFCEEMEERFDTDPLCFEPKMTQICDPDNPNNPPTTTPPKVVCP